MVTNSYCRPLRGGTTVCPAPERGAARKRFLIGDRAERGRRRGMRALGVHRFVAVLAAFVLVLSSSPQAADAVSTCSGTTLVPNLTRFEVNQGLGSYDRLTRGKPALVRAYFSLPDSTTCTLGSGQALNITGATLNVVGGGSSNSGIAAANAAGFATSAALSARPALVDSSHDPFFAVSGSILAPSRQPGPLLSRAAAANMVCAHHARIRRRVSTAIAADLKIPRSRTRRWSIGPGPSRGAMRCRRAS